MLCRIKPYEIGDLVTVKSSYPYQLPEGLEHGSKVKVLAFDIGTRIVETEDGRQFEFNSGMERLECGKWVQYSSAFDIPPEDGGKSRSLGGV